MSDVTRMYDKDACHGFVKRQDGYWWIRDGSLTSMSDAQGRRLEQFSRTVFLVERTPHFAECLGYVKAMLQHRAASALYKIGKALS